MWYVLWYISYWKCFLKQFSNVPFITHNAPVYGDTGRHELYIRSTIGSIIYWPKILKIKYFWCVKRVYNMILNRNTSNSSTHQIKYVLYELNLGEYWENIHYNINNCLVHNRNKLIAISDNKWSACIARINTCRVRIYTTFKLYRFKKNYKNLKIIWTRKRGKLVTCFRLEMSDIFVHSNIFDNNAQCVCVLCIECEEDEFHFCFNVLYSMIYE